MARDPLRIGKISLKISITESREDCRIWKDAIVLEVWLSHRQIMTEVYHTKCGGLYRGEMRYEC